jgi:hypothetical protein
MRCIPSFSLYIICINLVIKLMLGSGSNLASLEILIYIIDLALVNRFVSPEKRCCKEFTKNRLEALLRII